MARALEISVEGKELSVTGTGFYFAYKETNLTGSDNDLRFTDKVPGVNTRTVTYVDPGGTTAALDVTVASGNVTVHLARAGSAIVTTADDIIAAVAADSEASLLVVATLKSGSDGSGVVTAMSAMTLDTETPDTNVDITVIAPDGSFVIQEEVDAGNTGAISLGDESFELSQIGTIYVTAKISGQTVATASTRLFSS